jgi:CRP-like cAMP-binding protein
MSVYELVPYLSWLAALLFLVGSIVRDTSRLRGLFILGSLCAALYFLLVADIPLWDGIIAAAAIALANLWHLLGAKTNNRRFDLSAEEMMLYARLPGIAPGDFKQLLAIAQWNNQQSVVTLTQEGKMPDALHYVLEGQVTVTKGAKTFNVGPHAFIGELAFLRGKPATATTQAHAGSLVVSWPQNALRALMKSNDNVRQVIDGLLTADMAEKVARTTPPLLQEQTS